MIEIFISQRSPEIGYVWNVEDVFKLRQDHRIIGSLAGCLPATPRQDNFLGVPLILSQEEIDLAVKEGFGKTISAPVLTKLPSLEIKSAFDDQRHRNGNDQIEVYRENRKREIVKMSDQIIEGKRRKMSEKSDLKLDESSVDLTRDKILEREFARIKDVSQHQQIVQTFNSHPWIREEDKKPFEWRSPSKERDQIRRLTFRSLWLRGFHITSGDKFGGDFLLYAGDPVLFHAQFVVICSTESELSGFRDRDLVCRNRLGTAVKKTILIAYAQGTINNGDGNAATDEEISKVIVFKALRRLNIKKKK